MSLQTGLDWTNRRVLTMIVCISEHKTANRKGTENIFPKVIFSTGSEALMMVLLLNLSCTVWILINDTSEFFLLQLLNLCFCFCPCPIIWLDERNYQDSCWLQMLCFPWMLTHSFSLKQWTEWQEMMVTTVQLLIRKFCITLSLTKQTRKEPASSVFVYSCSLLQTEF